MAPSSTLWSWILLAVVLSGANAQRNTCSTGIPSSGAHCLRRQGREYASAYCSSVLPLTTPTSTKTSTTTNTVVKTSTTTTQVVTLTGTPPITTTIPGTTTINSTTTFTETSTTITGTFTTYVDTTTITSTSFSNVYTCGNQSFSAIASGSASASITASVSASVSASASASRSGSVVMSSSMSSFVSSGGIFSTSSGGMASASFSFRPTGVRPTGLIPTGSMSSMFSVSSSQPAGNLSVSMSYSASMSASASLVPYHLSSPEIVKRQTPSPTSVKSIPACLHQYSKTYGLVGVKSACNCLAIATPSPVTLTTTFVDPSTTVTSTSTISTDGTTTVTPTTTATSYSTATLLFSTTTTMTESDIATHSATYTLPSVTTSIITTSSPTPTAFNIYYNTESNDTPTANFFKAVTAPGGSGIVLAVESEADSFKIDAGGRLEDINRGGAFIAKNTDDLYPFDFLQVTASTLNTLICSTCNGVLQCDFPGTTGNTFALCYGFLATGQPSIFGKDSNGDGHVDCVPITLQLK